MSCSSDALDVDSGGTVTTVVSVLCVSIPNTVVSFKDGDTKGWVFKETASTIETIDFTNAKNLKNVTYKNSSHDTFSIGINGQKCIFRYK